MELVGPLAGVLAQSRTVLLCGCGGGSDILGTVPLYFALQAAFPSLSLRLASLTDADRSLKDRKIFNKLFEEYPADHLRQLTPVCWEVRYGERKEGEASGEQKAGDTAVCRFPAKDYLGDRYFPEHTLSRWFAEKTGRDVPIFAISQRRGTVGIAEAYRAINDVVHADTVLLVDVGIDSVMFGYEPHLGTPLQDMMSLCAIDQLQVPFKALLCFGLGLEPIGEVNFFHNLSVLQSDGGFLGTSCVVGKTPPALRYTEAVDFCGNSSLNEAIAQSVKGNFLQNSHVQPLTQLMWFFSVPYVARRIHYLPLIRELDNFVAVQETIEKWRAANVHKKKEEPCSGGMWGHIMSDNANNKHFGQDHRIEWSHPWPRGYPKSS